MMTTRGQWWHHWQPTEKPHRAQRPSHPGVIADDERKARGWSVEELRKKLPACDYWKSHLGDFLGGRYQDERDAADLARAFVPTTPDFWRKLYQNWRDWTPERECMTCRHEAVEMQDEPCRTCKRAKLAYALWQPKDVTP